VASARGARVKTTSFVNCMFERLGLRLSGKVVLEVDWICRRIVEGAAADDDDGFSGEYQELYKLQRAIHMS
jgi:hypothetical protein